MKKIKLSPKKHCHFYQSWGYCSYKPEVRCKNNKLKRCIHSDCLKCPMYRNSPSKLKSVTQPLQELYNTQSETTRGINNEI